MHCFNCGYSCSFTLGRSINNKTKQYLRWCGADGEQIQKWSLESLAQKDLIDFTQPKKKRDPVKFKTTEIPDGELLDETNPKHKKFIDYIRNRGIDPYSYPFMVTPDAPGRYAERVIIPYTYGNKIVGHTSRFLDNRTPKYINEQQPGYVFNMDVQHNDWQVCIVVEGIFDALAIDGVAIMHDDISTEQAQVLANLNKQIIVVPDRDKTGLQIIDKALEYGYSVSLPDWDPDIKDANDAVRRYGKLATILSILQNATMSKIKLELRKKQIAKGI